MNKLTKFLAVSLLSFTAMAFGQQTTSQKGEGTATAQDVKTIPLQTNPSKSGITPNNSYVSGAGYVTSTWALLGSSAYPNYTFTITNLHLYTASPATVHCQTRQYWNYDYDYPDQFACQVIETDYDHVKVRVRRLDQYTGWGQQLRIDLLIYEWVNN
jgi:hypothetical protein